MDDDPRLFMRLAVDEALRSPEGGARVGAVVVRDGAVLATGHKGEDGSTKHAECIAIEKAATQDVDLAGATAYVTLEPCTNIESNRTCCADRLAEAGIVSVYIGRYDKNPRINRLGWKALRAHSIDCYDFEEDFRDEIDELNSTFDQYFLQRNGLAGRARFDYTQNGGRYILAATGDADAATWQTAWRTRGSDSVYANAGRPGYVALARYARVFSEIDDPDAYDYGNHFAELTVGSIAIYRNEHGHALVRLVDVEPPAPYGSTPHVSVTIDYELRPFRSARPLSPGD